MNVENESVEARQQQKTNAAQSMIERYGDRAWQEATIRVAELEALGERAPAAFWSEIARLIAILQQGA